jgi:hypothetical protein
METTTLPCEIARVADFFEPFAGGLDDKSSAGGIDNEDEALAGGLDDESIMGALDDGPLAGALDDEDEPTAGALGIGLAGTGAAGLDGVTDGEGGSIRRGPADLCVFADFCGACCIGELEQGASNGIGVTHVRRGLRTGPLRCCLLIRS